MNDTDDPIIILDGILRSMTLAQLIGIQALQILRGQIKLAIFKGIEPEEENLLEAWVKFIDILIKEHKEK